MTTKEREITKKLGYINLFPSHPTDCEMFNEPYTEYRIDALKERLQRGTSWSLIYEKEQIDFLAGFDIVNNNTAECWAVFEKDPIKPIHSARVIKELYDEVVKKYNFNRYQSIVRKSNERSLRWMRHIDMKKESVLKNFYQGEDFYMFRRLTND